MPTHTTAYVASNTRWSESIYRIRVVEPAIARAILPGQFVMIRPHGRLDPLLARPLAMYDVFQEDGCPSAVDLVYLVHGNGTKALSTLREGDRVDVWGPLGNTFPRDPASADLRRVMLLAGGIGQTPFLAVAKELLGLSRFGTGRMERKTESVVFGWGVRSAAALAGLGDFQALPIETHVATEDGSAGRLGRVTDLAREVIRDGDRPTAIFSCGPEPMLAAVARLGSELGIPTWVSLETKMACGYGVCFSCVCPVRDAQQPAGWDYARVCIEGPIFPSSAIEWAQLA
jgi:dihydroorotate dehydrogenase electron transfer subunit